MKISAILPAAAILLLKGYQKTRYLRQPSCRFYPSCSQYMIDGIGRHGFFKGLLLGCVRLCKCHPLHDGGVDEVPVTFSMGKFFQRAEHSFSKEYSTDRLTGV